MTGYHTSQTGSNIGGADSALTSYEQDIDSNSSVDHWDNGYRRSQSHYPLLCQNVAGPSLLPYSAPSLSQSYPQLFEQYPSLVQYPNVPTMPVRAPALNMYIAPAPAPGYMNPNPYTPANAPFSTTYSMNAMIPEPLSVTSDSSSMSVTSDSSSMTASKQHR